MGVTSSERSHVHAHIPPSSPAYLFCVVTSFTLRTSEQLFCCIEREEVASNEVSLFYSDLQSYLWIYIALIVRQRTFVLSD